ncbi:MAG: protein-glutamate O-methyltransferase CheR [Eubacteriales bacterium]|nr:protein-glutamate O-methyltransferase CheR [Eubacteriales bacterium]
MIYIHDDEFNAISSYIKKNYGVNLTKKKPLIEGRLGNYISNLGFGNYMDYFEYAKNDQTNDEMTILINKLTTNHTYFFRENEHFEFYREQVLPWIKEGIKTKDLRVWSAGCSSGQEPYTLAMITMDYLGTNAASWEHTILASDISNKVLSIAKNGIYTRDELEEVPHSWVKQYFTAYDDHKFVVSERLKKSVAYRNFNLLSPFQFKKPFQCILCRNVMIYFDVPTKNEIVQKFYDALEPGGYFMVGHSESLSACKHEFKYIKPSIYQKA